MRKCDECGKETEELKPKVIGYFTAEDDIGHVFIMVCEDCLKKPIKAVLIINGEAY